MSYVTENYLVHKALGNTWIKCIKERLSTNAQSAKKCSLLTKARKIVN